MKLQKVGDGDISSSDHPRPHDKDTNYYRLTFIESQKLTSCLTTQIVRQVMPLPSHGGSIRHSALLSSHPDPSADQRTSTPSHGGGKSSVVMASDRGTAYRGLEGANGLLHHTWHLAEGVSGLHEERETCQLHLAISPISSVGAKHADICAKNY